MSINLYKRNTHTYKKYLKRIMETLGALLIFLIIVHTLNYMYATDDIWTRILWHYFYEDKDRIDNIYLGSSHVYSDINPALLDELNGQYNFNLSTPAQRLSGSYYLLKEAERTTPVSHVYLELYYNLSTKSHTGIDPVYESYHSNWINTDYMENSWNRLQYAFSIIIDTNKCEDIFFPFIRYREKIGDWDYISETMHAKENESYLAYEHLEIFEDTNNVTEYRKQGYFYSTLALSEADLLFEQSKILEENPMGKTSEEYLRKIIKYCQKRNIPITLFVSPIPDLKLVSTENYDNYVSQVKNIAEEYRLPFYDFNLVKEEYLSLHPHSFRDFDHLNDVGAGTFTPFFNEVVSGDITDNEKYFYTSYEEKLQNTSPAIYGIYYWYSETIEEIPERRKTFRIASNREEEMEYTIILTPNDGDSYTVQYFTNNKEFSVPANEHGICMITARTTDTPDTIQTLEINY